MGIQYILDRDGIGVIEFHDARIIVEQLHYDSIYHEHLFYFSIKTLTSFFKDYNLFPFDFDFSSVSNLSAESIEKLSSIRPENLGQASRIDGVTPAAILILLSHIKKSKIKLPA